MKGRTSQEEGYRYGFNGKEKDGDIAYGSYDFGARMYNAEIGRWTARDPLERKYPDISTYAFVGNSPIVAIDPDGKKILITTSSGEQIEYKAGMDIPTDKFAKKVVESLNQIHNTSDGNSIVSSLVSSDVNLFFKKAEVLNLAGGNIAQFDDTNMVLGENGEYDKKVEKLVRNDNIDEAKKFVSGVNNIAINVYDGNFERAWGRLDGVRTNVSIAIAHEVFHAYQFVTGKYNGDFIQMYATKNENGTNYLEVQAVGFENYFRVTAYNNTDYEGPRLKYSSADIPEYHSIIEDKYLGFIDSEEEFTKEDFKKGGKGYIKYKGLNEEVNNKE